MAFSSFAYIWCSLQVLLCGWNTTRMWTKKSLGIHYLWAVFSLKSKVVFQMIEVFFRFLDKTWQWRANKSFLWTSSEATAFLTATCCPAIFICIAQRVFIEASWFYLAPYCGSSASCPFISKQPPASELSLSNMFCCCALFLFHPELVKTW